MISQISKWGNSQGVRIPKKLLQNAFIGINDAVEITARDNALVITPVNKKSLAWFLEGYKDEPDRYDWGESDDPKGRELI